ncbi:hypothetical protein CP556_14740 [Natrinema sp. CBA1119]|uniref:DUF7344 domain-containing protein n=1 Tax=Natrinema sp. CBA1119 TaxID=1608465 RepID=UPI000BF2D5A6|nr:hypothetical protein [Natrinema sp. CBA1119]PGF18366.1 hypothetical protein CP556_14740 [Natrinema sp. CBA1119]
MIENIIHETRNQCLSNDVLSDILSHKRRRFALYCLERYQTPMALADLADEVARLEYDAATLPQIPGEDVKEIYLDLYHSHIPKMEDASFIKYYQEEDMVSLRYEFSDLNLGEFM